MKEHLREYCHAGDVHINRPTDVEAARAAGIKLGKHATAREVRKAIGRAEYDRMFRFCVVRNPFVRTLSLFRFLKFNFRAWPRSDVMDQIDTLEEFVSSPLFASAGPGGIISPQVHWLTTRSHRGRMNYIARVEQVENDLCNIKDRLAMPPSPHPLFRRNASKGDPEEFGTELLSGTVIDAVRVRYDVDFQSLGYSSDPGGAMERERRSIAIADAR